MFTYGLYIFVAIALLISLIKDKKKTLVALKKAWKSFEGILPLLLSIVLIIGLMLVIISPQVISKLIGQQSGFIGITIAAIFGSVTLIPGFITFPLAASLLENGAGFVQIAVFISTSMMVGIVTMPIELKYFGRKATVIRNLLALIFSFVIAFVIGVIFH